MTTPRGIRNNNPGNIRVGDPWQGLMERDQMTPEQKREKAFCVFQSPKWGVRAIARLLVNYQDKHGLNTIRGMIDRWAPPVENNTMAYVEAVCLKVGVGPDTAINIFDYAVIRPMVQAIILHENGQQPYTDAQIDAGLVLAGVEPPQKRLLKEGEVKGAATVTVGGAVTSVAGVAAGLSPVIPFAERIKDNLWLLIPVGLIVICAGGYVIWQQVKKRRLGLA